MEQVSVYAVKKSSVSRWWFVIGFFVLASAPFLLMYGHAVYIQYRGEKAVDALAHALEEAEKNNLAAKMRDTVGGKTPQETLQLYIAAVEKGDYELASKYLVEKNREKELKALLELSVDKKIDWYLGVIKKATLKLESNISEYKAGDMVVMKSKIPEGYYEIDFEKYPNGVWKIIEI